MDENQYTIIAFVNGKSGGQQGAKVKQKLEEVLKTDHVFDLSQGGPEPGLKNFAHHKNLRVIACGGDGTVCWVMSVLDKLKWKTWPSIAVLPLGTGNDMARVLLWGNGYEGEPLDGFIDGVKQGHTIQLDRWKVSYVALTIEEKLSYSSHIKSTEGDEEDILIEVEEEHIPPIPIPVAPPSRRSPSPSPRHAHFGRMLPLAINRNYQDTAQSQTDNDEPRHSVDILEEEKLEERIVRSTPHQREIVLQKHKITKEKAEQSPRSLEVQTEERKTGRSLSNQKEIHVQKNKVSKEKKMIKWTMLLNCPLEAH